MLDSLRHYNTFAWPHIDEVVAEFDPEPPFPDEEKLVLMT